jgi:hypothetical protein
LQQPFSLILVASSSKTEGKSPSLSEYHWEKEAADHLTFVARLSLM